MNDINKAVREWLLGCPDINGNKILFNFLTIEDGSQGFILDDLDEREDICGNDICTYTFIIVDFRAFDLTPLGFSDGDIDDAVDVSKINAWIRKQYSDGNYPYLGDDVSVEDIRVPSLPSFSGADSSQGLDLAKYMIQVRIDYIKYN